MKIKSTQSGRYYLKKCSVCGAIILQDRQQGEERICEKCRIRQTKVKLDEAVRTVRRYPGYVVECRGNCPISSHTRDLRIRIGQ